MDLPKGNLKNSSNQLVDKDWKKLVSIIPPNAVSLKENKEEGKGMSTLDISNKSSDHILFKVKTTDPNNYVVRPN